MSPHAIRLRADGCIVIDIVGDSDEPIAEEFSQELTAIFAAHPGQVFSGLVNLSQAGSSTVAAQKVFASALSHPQVGKVAFVAAGGVARVFAEFVVKFSRKERVHFFDSPGDAAAWLRE